MEATFDIFIQLYFIKLDLFKRLYENGFNNIWLSLMLHTVLKRESIAEKNPTYSITLIIFNCLDWYPFKPCMKH